MSSQAVAQNEQRSVRRPETTSASAGHDPQAGQYPCFHSRRAAIRSSLVPLASSVRWSAHAIGGAAQFYARSIKKVDDVSLLEFGTPEAMWHLMVEDFPAIVTMDAHGNSLHKDIEEESGQHLEAIGV